MHARSISFGMPRQGLALPGSLCYALVLPWGAAGYRVGGMRGGLFTGQLWCHGLFHGCLGQDKMEPRTRRRDGLWRVALAVEKTTE